MHFFLILYLLYSGVEAKLCVTPTGQKGECVLLKSCPSLLWSFANYKWGNQHYLLKFVCPNTGLGAMVCCQLTTDYLVFENEQEKHNPNHFQKVKLANTKDCGINNNMEITDGIARLQDFPWLVKIIATNVTYSNFEDRSVQNVQCTGVLISTRHILYTAYCHKFLLKSPTLPYFIRIDSYTNKGVDCNKNSYSPECRNFEVFEADIQLKHSFYDYKTMINNIAIITLNHHVQVSDFIRPICLPTLDYSINVGQTLYTAGWNRTFNSNDISVKISQSSVYISNEDCINRLLVSDSNISLSLYEMCTYTERNDIDIDITGLPLMSLKDDRWYLQGFQSHLQNVQVYIRIQNYLQWVQETLGREMCHVDFNNQTGECMHIGYCPKMLNAFANPAPEDEKVLSDFMCRYGRKKYEPVKDVLKVCCGLTTPPETTNKNIEFEISNFKFCGLQHRDDYLSNDDSITIDEFPWLALIINATTYEHKIALCGGTLISDRYVLTSGQCCSDFNLNDTMLVRLGDHLLRNSSDCIDFVQFGSYDCTETQEHFVEDRIIHPFFNQKTFYNDIALLRLNTTVVFSSFVRPICISNSEDHLPKPGEILTTTGFGDIDRQGMGHGLKKKIQTALISNEECQARYNALDLSISVTQYQICTLELENSTDVTCIGDEGGPLMYRSKKLHWFIQGISSTFGCGDKNLPQNYLKVNKYLKWIKLNMRNFT